MYNKRGWTNELFTKEDRVLLNEKFNELNPKVRQKKDNVLGDGSRIVEVNNKIVLIGGTFDEPEIHCVFLINAINDTYADGVKEIIFYETENSRNKYEFEEQLYNAESYLGQNKVRTYSQDDFRYNSRRNETWQRATLPSDFQHYGYTKQFQDGAGTDTETERGISNEINSGKYQEHGNAEYL